MAQWGQGYQYPMQTGFNPQQQFQPQLAPQPTGFPGQRPPAFQQPQPTGFPGHQGFQQPQQTGFPGQQGFQQPQQTGFPGQQLQPQPTGFPGSNFQQQRPPPPPVPPIPAQFQQQQPQQPQQNAQGGGFLSAQQPANRFLGSSPGLAPLTTQPTGFPSGGGLRPLMPQATGFIDPRLQMMSSTFLPANTSAPYNAAGMPQFQQQQSGFSLQQSFQQHNQAQRGNAAPKIPWALSKAEKKSYDQIFRAWDTGNTGFISGETALEVFGQSGLDRNDLAKIWALADVENRGKLNLAEFHVAMGLIYRRLNGNEIPDVLPPELESVDVLKDILKNDTRARSPAGIDSGPASRMRERSFYNSTATGAGGRQDATVYKYKDETPAGGFYQPRSRHVDRSAIRTSSESASPSADLDDMKRQLENTAKMLDKVAEESAQRTAEDDALEREMSDLKYRVKRVQEDLEYVSRGPRSVARDDERRKLERELLELMHDKLPDLERRIKDREERREREKREWARERDRRNERFGRFDDRDGRYSPRYDRDREPYDRPRSAYDRDDRDRDYYRDRDRDYDRERDRDYGRDRPYSRNRDRDRDYDRPRSPPKAPSPPPPPPPPAPASTESRPPPPAPTPSTTAAAKKNLSPEERTALARQRIQERMAALGVVAPSPSPKLDTSVEDRLAQEKKEAEEKAKAAEREAEERERLRRERLEGEKALKEGRSPTSPRPPSTTPTRAPAAPAAAPQVPTPKPTPPPAPTPKAKPPAPPPPRKGPAPRPPAPRAPSSVSSPAAPPAPAPSVAFASSLTPAPPAAPAQPPAPVVDPEEEALRAREEALRKQREERLARIKQLEQEEEEARLAEERRRQELLQQRSVPPAAPIAPPAPPAPDFSQAGSSPVRAAPQPPPAPPAPPVSNTPTATPSVDKSATNPFSRLMKESPGSASTSPGGAANGSTNPFFKNQAASPPAAPPAPSPPAAAPPAPAPPAPPAPTKSPAPPTVKTTYHTAPGDSEDDWEDVREKDDEASSEDELDSSRDTRDKLARQLFSSILPPSRPQSAAASVPSKPAVSPGPEPSNPAPPPPPPPPPSAPPMGANIPAAPAAPIASPAPTGDRSALLNAIQAGKKLRKAQTNDRSGAALSGKVLGDTAPPSHISAAPRVPSPSPPPPAEHHEPEMPTPPPMDSVKSSHRESVDWYAGLAAEGSAVSRGPSEPLQPTIQEEEEPQAPVLHIQIDTTEDPNALADVDMSVEYRVRSLYAYQAQRPEELTFGENMILTVHPSKSGSDWWYGTLVRDGKSGFFPKTYVEQVTTVIAHALYDYNGSNADELPFSEGDQLTIVDRTDADWWKAESGGVVFIVPASYLSVADAAALVQTPYHADPDATVPDVSSREQPTPAPEADDTESERSEEDESSDSDYATDSDTDDSEDEEELSEEARRQERQARAAERQRVLEAAGLIIKTEAQPPPRLARARSHRRRRPAPAVPERSPDIPASPAKELPPVPESDSANNSLRLDDAFERYEAYRQNHLAMNRLSLASIESATSTSPRSSTFSLTPVASEGGESRHHSFLHFFGRSRTPVNDGESRAMPVISGPILQRKPSLGPSEGDAAFGSSWASLVDKSALEEIPTQERRRQEAIFELIVTEGAYVRDLQLIVEHFYANVYDLLDEKARTVIFANVEDILLMNTVFYLTFVPRIYSGESDFGTQAFLSSLEERQKECRLYIDKIGDILSINMAHLDVYMDYCVNQGSATKVLQSLRQSNPELSACLQRLRDDPTARNLDLSSYLLVPMQRITRYPLLFKQIIHYTEPGEDRDQIESAQRKAEKVLNHINETIREQEGRERLKEISKELWVGQGRLDLTAPTRYMGARKLLREGVLMKAKSGRRLRAFLCSDILVLTEEGSMTLYRMPLSLSEVEVREPTGKDNTTFQLAVSYPRGGDAVTLRAASPRECQSWMYAIHGAAKQCREAQRRAARMSRG
ncbi:hypothetical protein BD414DRAFT_498547 [Trametes punicea]|nr:hypothetical protein BD414DRAFT_498547 [Trametes punicea]